MKIGTKSVLFGIHQFAIHPWFVAWGWWKLYGFRRIELRRSYELGGRWRITSTSILSPRLWLAFFVHDVGYIGKPNMDGAEGETHPEVGAKIMRVICGDAWGDFVLTHSRYYAKRLGIGVSALCMADKLAFMLTPKRLYLWLANRTGEIHEYMPHSSRWPELSALIAQGREREAQSLWWDGVAEYMHAWIEEHKDGRTDTWTPRRAA